MTIKIVSDRMSRKELKELAKETFLEMVKAVVDVRREVVAVGGELHADAEAHLLNDGSRQEDLWGINLYLDKPDENRIEYSALINIRPRHGNVSLTIQSQALRDKIGDIVRKRILLR